MGEYFQAVNLTMMETFDSSVFGENPKASGWEIHPMLEDWRRNTRQVRALLLLMKHRWRHHSVALLGDEGSFELVQGAPEPPWPTLEQLQPRLHHIGHVAAQLFWVDACSRALCEWQTAGRFRHTPRTCILGAASVALTVELEPPPGQWIELEKVIP